MLATNSFYAVDKVAYDVGGPKLTVTLKARAVELGKKASHQ